MSDGLQQLVEQQLRDMGFNGTGFEAMRDALAELDARRQNAAAITDFDVRIRGSVPDIMIAQAFAFAKEGRNVMVNLNGSILEVKQRGYTLVGDAQADGSGEVMP